jgi:hypothetical protein
MMDLNKANTSQRLPVESSAISTFSQALARTSDYQEQTSG